LRFPASSRVQSWLQAGAAAPLRGAILVAASLMWVASAQAQGFTWGGVGSTTATTDYNLGINWNPSAGAPPVAAGQSAVFDATGSVTVVVTAGPVSPSSWTINATSQSYSISGAAVNFNLAGATGGIINNANAGQAISISNNIGESVAGVQLQQIGFSRLVLLGTNTYTGGTFISSPGILDLGRLATTGSIVGTVTNEGFFEIVKANTAGITSITNDGTSGPGTTIFFGANTAGTATIINQFGGSTAFRDTSSPAARRSQTS
jgi:autotransporter-associated beta strand protein